MQFTDKLLYCPDCHKNFTYSAAEQEYHAARGFPNEPRRCASCRRAKKTGHIQNENDTAGKITWRPTGSRK